MTLHAPRIARSCLPGNFVQLKIDFPGGGLWRRPFSILDTDGDNIRILYKALGRGTSYLTCFTPDMELNVIGPLGNSFSEPGRLDSIVLSGGGIGVPPLYFLAKDLLDKGYPPKNIHFFNGAADAGALVFLDEIADLGVSTYAVTEDGSMGIKGFVTEGVMQFLMGMGKMPVKKETSLYACGPNPMLHVISKLAEEYEINCQLALESLMPCGFGICMGCAVKVRDKSAPEGYSFQRVCHEGPVFDARVIIWE